MTTLPADRACASAAWRSSVTTTPFPAASPSAFTTYGGPNSASVTYCQRQNDADSDYSVFVTVTVSYNHPILLPIVGNIIDAMDGGGTPGSFRLTASEQMRVENRPDLTSADVSTLPACP